MFSFVIKVGGYSLDKLHIAGRKKYEEYGPLVLEIFPGNVNLLSVYDPDDIAKVLSQDGKFPSRRSHVALEHYRKKNPAMYSNGGLLPT